MEVEHHARRILQPEDLPGGRRTLERHAEGGGPASLAELGGRHQPVPHRPGARPAAGAHVGERDGQPAALGLDEPGLDRRIRLEDHPRVGGVRADAKLDAGRGPARRARQGAAGGSGSARGGSAGRAPPGAPRAGAPRAPAAGISGRRRRDGRHGDGARGRGDGGPHGRRRAPRRDAARLADRRRHPHAACRRAWATPARADRSARARSPGAREPARPATPAARRRVIRRASRATWTTP